MWKLQLMHAMMIGYKTYIPEGHTARLLLNWRSRTAATCFSSSAKSVVETGSTKRNNNTMATSRKPSRNTHRIVFLTLWRENNQNIWWTLFHRLAKYAYSPHNTSWKIWIWIIRWNIQGRNFVWRINYQLFARNILTRCQSGTYKMLLFLIQ